MFREGRLNLKLDPRSGRKQTQSSENNVNVQPSVRTLILTEFWEVNDVLLVDFLPPGETIHDVRYGQALEKLREAVRRKRPCCLTKGIIIQHDNATPHTTNLTTDWLRKYCWHVLTHTPHSPDLAPSDYHLFVPLKSHLAGQSFLTDEDLIEAVHMLLRSLDVTFFREGMFSLLHRWQKCIDRNGDYIEKQSESVRNMSDFFIFFLIKLLKL